MVENLIRYLIIPLGAALTVNGIGFILLFSFDIIYIILFLIGITLILLSFWLHKKYCE